MPAVSSHLLELSPEAFQKQDSGDDAEFYAPARLVTHIDEAAIQALTDLYRTSLPAGGIVLDLMSSWISHLPLEMAFAEVIDQGMNAEELSANSYPTRSFVQDLNRTQVLPFATGSCDAALCLVGVEYLQHSIEVFADVLRVLRPGAPFSCCSRLRSFPCAQENTKTESTLPSSRRQDEQCEMWRSSVGRYGRRKKQRSLRAARCQEHLDSSPLAQAGDLETAQLYPLSFSWPAANSLCQRTMLCNSSLSGPYSE